MEPDLLPSETRMLEELTAGAPAALSDLYEQYVAVVYGVALRVTSSPAAADEVTRAVFLGLWQRPERFDPTFGPLRPWLATVAHRHSVRWMRVVNLCPPGRLPTARAGPPELPDIVETVESVLRADRVRQAVAALSEEEQTCVQLAYFGGLTYRQIAHRLGLPPEAVRARLRHGLRHLAAALQPDVRARRDLIGGGTVRAMCHDDGADGRNRTEPVRLPLTARRGSAPMR